MSIQSSKVELILTQESHILGTSTARRLPLQALPEAIEAIMNQTGERVVVSHHLSNSQDDGSRRRRGDHTKVDFELDGSAVGLLEASQILYGRLTKKSNPI